MAAAHIEPEAFVRVFNELRTGDVQAAVTQWNQLSSWIPLLFDEPNPAPVKVWLADQGLVRSPECRLPLTVVSQQLREELRRRLPRDATTSVNRDIHTPSTGEAGHGRRPNALSGQGSGS